MEYFLIISFLFILFKIILCLVNRKLVFFTFFLICNDLYLLFSCFSQNNLDILFYNLYFLHELFSFLYIYVVYNSKIKINTICNGLPVNLNPTVYVFLILLVVIIGFKNNFDLNFRGNYIKLIESNRSGSPDFTIMVFVLLLLNTFSFKLRFLIPTLASCIMIGSKGLLLGPLIVYFSYYYFVYGINIKLISLGSICIAIMYFYLQNITSGFENFIDFYIYHYFDYVGNILSIIDNLDIFPRLEFVPPFINDYIPGFSRLFSVNKTDFYFEYFPSSMYHGKAPGLLNFEIFFRLGIIFSILFPLFNIIFFIFYLKLSIVLKSSFYNRVFIFSNNSRLLFILTISLLFKKYFIKIYKKI